MPSRYNAWRASGSPTEIAQPIADLVATLRRYGYTVYVAGNAAHMTAVPPEDHTPFSASGWPEVSLYPFIHALDIMPPKGSTLPTLAALGAQLVADRSAKHPGAAWIKYLNWSPFDKDCRHESWQPNHETTRSTDRGHIHISARSDYTRSRVAASYDPVARQRLQANAPRQSTSEDDDMMQSIELKTGTTPTVIMKPWAAGGCSIGCDFGAAQFRVGVHIVNVGWSVKTLTVRNTDAARTDIVEAAAPEVDRISIVRVAIDANDKLDTPASALVWG